MAACSATRCSVTRCSATRASGTVGQDPIRTARPPEPPPQVPRALPPRAAAASSPVGKPVREPGQVAKRPRAAVPAVVRQPTGARAPAVTALVAASPVTVAPGVAERAPLARQAPGRPPMQQAPRRPSTRLAPRAPAPPVGYRAAVRTGRTPAG